MLLVGTVLRPLVRQAATSLSSPPADLGGNRLGTASDVLDLSAYTASNVSPGIPFKTASNILDHFFETTSNILDIPFHTASNILDLSFQTASKFLTLSFQTA